MFLSTWMDRSTVQSRLVQGHPHIHASLLYHLHMDLHMYMHMMTVFTYSLIVIFIGYIVVL